MASIAPDAAITLSLRLPDRRFTGRLDTQGMWRLALALSLLVVVLPAATLATRAPAGALSIEGGRGVVVVRGNGGLLGRLARGTVELVDLTPTDQWKATVNGVPRSRRTFLKGLNVSFRILGGDYRLSVKGEGISISARGTGVATLLGVPGLIGDAGIYAADLNADCEGAPDQCQPIPTATTRVTFGVPETAAPTATK